MRTEKFNTLFDFAPKSKVKAGDGLDEGNFPFYTSSSILKKRINKAQYFDQALIFGSGGKASVHFAGEPFATSTDCMVAISINEEINTKFIYYYLFGNIQLLEQGFKGAGLKHISKKYIENLDIPVLPIEVQNKIVSVLDEAVTLIIKKEYVIKLLDELLRAVFLETFGDPATNSKQWSMYPISQIAESRLGKMLDGKNIVGNRLKKYLRNSNVQWLKFNLEDLLEMDFDERETLEFALKDGDILMCEGGEIGRCAIWRNEIEDCYFQKALHRIRLNNKLINSEYFVYMFWLYSKHGVLDKYMGAATISHLTGDKLKKIEIPVPPIELQSHFSSVYIDIDNRKSQQESFLLELDTLIKSLSQKAFNGQLNFNIDFELDGLIREIDLQKKENDLSKIQGDIAYLQRLVDKLNTQEFREKDLYDKAKHAAFQLMTEKEENRKVMQSYNNKTQSIELILK